MRCNPAHEPPVGVSEFQLGHGVEPAPNRTREATEHRLIIIIVLGQPKLLSHPSNDTGQKRKAPGNDCRYEFTCAG